MVPFIFFRATAVSSPIIIKRDAVSRFIDVGVEVGGGDLSAVGADIKGRLGQVKFPLEYHAEVLGAYAERQAASSARSVWPWPL